MISFGDSSHLQNLGTSGLLPTSYNSAGAPRLEVAVLVVGVQRSTREDVSAGDEGRPQVALQHEHLEPVAAVADEHDGGRVPNGNGHLK